MNYVEISNSELTVKIRLTGAELASVKCGDEEFIWEADEAVWGGSAPILFPICGGLKEDKYELFGKEYTMKKHGFLRGASFEVESRSESCVTLLTCSDAETLSQYPYEFEFRTTFELCGKTLKTTYSVDNKTDNVMYFSVGAHEAYACRDGIEDYYIEFEKKETLNSYILDGNLLDDNYITIKKDSDRLDLLYDYFAVDALVFKKIESRKASLVKKDGSVKIDVDFSGFNHLLLWTKPNGKYICIEPWNGLPDTVGSSFDITEKEGMQELAPFGKYEISHEITFEKQRCLC